MSWRAGPRERPRAVMTPPEIAMSAAKTSAAVPTKALRMTVSNTAMPRSFRSRQLHRRQTPQAHQTVADQQDDDRQRDQQSGDGRQRRIGRIAEIVQHLDGQ